MSPPNDAVVTDSLPPVAMTTSPVMLFAHTILPEAVDSVTAEPLGVNDTVNVVPPGLVLT